MQDNKIRHLAIAMDGNARWAKREGLTKMEGHKHGAENAKKLLPIVSNLAIPYLTLYSFSYENWKRSESEVSYLLGMLSHYLKYEVSSLIKNGVKLKVIGNLSKLSSSLRAEIDKVTKATESNNKITLCIAFSYGGRQEIVDACQKVIDSGIDKITEEEFKNYMYDSEMPDVDLLIRPGGVFRISNFLLWQSAYSELYFLDKFWPEFTEADLLEAISDYSRRKRNFGAR